MKKSKAKSRIAAKARTKKKPGQKSKSTRSRSKVAGPVKAPKLSAFTLRTKLVKLGSRAHTVAETPSLALYLRVYSPHEGPNAMHTRPYMDHAFTVLQGKARFHTPAGEVMEIGRNEGMLVPAGAYYCLENSGEDVLVLLCSASLARHKGNPDIRLSVQGKHIDSHSPENLRRADCVNSDDYFE